MSSPHTFSPTFISLPPELIENTLILSASSGYPSCIAALARTCKYLHALIYDSPDHHLWREVFLTTFDDPRPGAAYLNGADTLGASAVNAAVDTKFNWAQEFIQRMSAAKFIREYSASPSKPQGEIQDQSSVQVSPLPAIKALLSVISTILPFRCSPALIKFASACLPVLPPLSLIISYPLPIPCVSRSSNAAWIEDVLKGGYPPALTRGLFTIPTDDEDARLGFLGSAECEDSEEGRLFYKLLFLTGFVQNQCKSPGDSCTTSESAPTAPQATSATGPRELAGQLSDGDSGSPVSLSATSVEQLAFTRNLARRKVYDLQYLARARCWGPFLPITRKAASSDGERSGAPDPAMRDAAHSAQVLIRRIQNVFEDDDGEFSDDEGEYEPSDAGDVGDDVEADAIRDILASLPVHHPARAQSAQPHVPSPHLVVPDYAFLAAARMLVEANLRDMLHGQADAADEGLMRAVKALRHLECVRMGGAPGFWEGWANGAGEGEEAAEGGVEKGEGSAEAKEGTNGAEDVRGWDWAGVAGEWKRSICWLDYRDLLSHNIAPRFADMEYNLQEITGIFPMTLRIAGYSRPPTRSDPPATSTAASSPHPPTSSAYAAPPDSASLVWRLPVIHVEGESTGSDTDQHTMKRIKGTVSMIGDDAVRWSLTSSYGWENDGPQWVTEGVQVGCIGSALGVLGMWTGAEHTRMDPLGPFWAWKVG